MVFLAERFGIDAVGLNVSNELRLIVLTGSEADESNKDNEESVYCAQGIGEIIGII